MKKHSIKRTISILIIGILLFVPINVKAYSGEIDPENYISPPGTMWQTGNIADGTIYISSLAGDNYSLYYQSIELTLSQYSEILNKLEVCNGEIEKKNTEYNETMAAEKLKLDEAEEEYNTIKNDTSKTNEEKETARKAYNNLVEEYNKKNKELHEILQEEVEKLKKDYYSYLPTFSDNNWTQTTDRNVQIDVSQYSGEIYFILWVKLTNSEGTYYDYGLYSADGTKQITLSLDKTTAEIEVGNTVQLTATTNSEKTVEWSSDKENIATVNSSGLVTGIAEGVATITAKVEGKTVTCVVTVKAKEQTDDTQDDEEEDGAEEDNQDGLTWTDFSNAKIRLVRENYRSSYYIVVSGVNFDMDTYDRYEIYFSTNKNSMPDINEENSSDGWQILHYNPTNKYFDGKTELGKLIETSQYELSGDKLYVWVRERQRNTNGTDYKYKMQLSEIEVDRLPQGPLGTRITAYFFDHETSIFLWDYYDTANKNVKYKIGKVTDKNVLKAIKNGEAGCLDKLMTYAKNANNGYTGTCKIGDSDSITNKLGLVDDEYYYVYFELDTENGKYYPIEDVSLYQALCYTDNKGNYSANLFDYLDDNFVWDLSDEEVPKEDDTISKEEIPDTGKTAILAISILTLATVVAISYKKYKNLKGI